MYRVMLLKKGTRVQVTGHEFGTLGRITRVIPSIGVYWVDNAVSVRAVRPGRETIETLSR